MEKPQGRLRCMQKKDQYIPGIAMHTTPKILLGSAEGKQFGHKWYGGEVSGCDIDTDTSEVTWEGVMRRWRSRRL